MAGIKETKEQLHKEILELYKRFTSVKPEDAFSAAANKSQLHAHADLATTLSKKIETLACLSAIEEEKIISPITEIKKPEVIPVAEKIIPWVAEIKQPENVPAVEKIVPPIAEIKQPEIIPVTKKIIPPIAEIKQPEIVPVVEKIIPPVAEIKKPEVIPVAEKIIPPAAEIKKTETVPPVTKTFPALKSFIGFNEKLMFMRLFNNSGDEYENALAQLNSSVSYKEAETILNNLSTAYNWPADAEPVQIFYSIVKRRFA